LAGGESWHFASKTPYRPKKIKPFTLNMKDNTQIAHTKFQKNTTSPTGVIAKRKKNGKSFFSLSALFIFLIVKNSKSVRKPKKKRIHVCLIFKRNPTYLH
jgi:hypothetical protein